MADDVDRAQERTETLRQDALDRSRRARDGIEAGDGWCSDCGEDIPPERIKALGRVPERCASCQEEFETEGHR